MTRPRPRGRRPAAPLRVDRFPTLQAFFSGYLHQDFVAEHTTPEAACRAFMRDADARERAVFDREAEELMADAAGVPFGQVADFIYRGLGGAWRPGTIDELATALGRRRH